MTALVWDAVGERRFETGIDRGVLYPIDGSAGAPWNGLTAINQKVSGGTPTPYYLDGVKFWNEPSAEEYEATLEAFTYPDEFAKCDGTYVDDNGIFYDQQPRQMFNLAYRTIVGNDISGVSKGYKLHLITNALASPTERNYSSISDTIKPLTLSWDLTTIPIVVPGYKPTAHIIINSTNINSYLISLIEDILYGTTTTIPRFPTISDLTEILTQTAFEVIAETITGLSPLLDSETPDIIGHENTGLYRATRHTQLNETSIPGLYTLEN